MNVAHVATVLLVVTRYMRAFEPIWAKIPSKWRWVFPALCGAAATAAEALQTHGTTTDKITAVITWSVVPLVLAFMGGHGDGAPGQAPQQASEPTVTAEPSPDDVKVDEIAPKPVKESLVTYRLLRIHKSKSPKKRAKSKSTAAK